MGVHIAAKWGRRRTQFEQFDLKLTKHNVGSKHLLLAFSATVFLSPALCPVCLVPYRGEKNFPNAELRGQIHEVHQRLTTLSRVAVKEASTALTGPLLAAGKPANVPSGLFLKQSCVS